MVLLVLDNHPGLSKAVGHILPEAGAYVKAVPYHSIPYCCIHNPDYMDRCDRCDKSPARPLGRVVEKSRPQAIHTVKSQITL